MGPARPAPCGRLGPACPPVHEPAAHAGSAPTASPSCLAASAATAAMACGMHAGSPSASSIAL
eukprot:9899685-Lingulodinium_polyedra.AAC.1